MSSLDVTSWSMIARAAAGGCTDQELFAKRYAPVVRSYFAARWKLGQDHERVQDAVQDVFVECFGSGGALQRANADLGSFRGFLFGVARRVASSIERRWVRRREFGGNPQERARSEATASMAFDQAWARAIVREAADLAQQRAAGDEAHVERLRMLRLRFEEGLPPRDIALRLGCEASHVYEKLRQAKHDVRGAFLEVMAAYHPDATEAELKRRCIELAAGL